MFFSSKYKSQIVISGSSHQTRTHPNPCSRGYTHSRLHHWGQRTHWLRVPCVPCGVYHRGIIQVLSR